MLKLFKSFFLLCTFLIAFPILVFPTDLRTVACTMLSSTAAVDMKTASAKRTLYTVPTGKTAIVMFVVVRSPSATLAGGTSYAFGWTATCNDWKTGINLSGMTATTDFYVADLNNTKATHGVAANTFGMYITTGATNAATATIEVYGYVF
jgi:hypothetical protein